MKIAMLKITPKHICLFNTYQAWGGAEKWYDIVARWFRNRGHAVVAVTHINSVLFHRLSQAGISAYPLRISNLSFLNPVAVLSVARIFRNHRIDAVILNLSADAKVAGLAARLAGVRQVIYRRGTALPVRDSWLNRVVFKHFLTDVVANSEEIKRTILQNNPLLVPGEHLHVIYNGLDLAAYERQKSPPLFPKQDGKIILGNAGRFVEQKGQHYLLKAAKCLKDRGMNFTLYIAGTGALEQELRSYANELGVEEEVKFVGFVNDIKGFMENLDIFLFPSLHEGSSHTLLEAMASSKPIVAFDVSSMPEIIVSGETGILVELGNVQAFSEAILSLSGDRELRERFGRSGRRRFEQKFTLAHMLQDIAHLVEHEERREEPS
ncbi:group 1 glycosyl transferase [candidate division KSB3 bacterium]|uniref:Group 1 glycosyl transferase n=1 Tax=candidate division KSB3 bacterium TaxID=2044937 RepID=A0A2G6KG31_9BACT|nr:MAG: group 1 glycosyl transferase [candidate division KSB3 bacterium]